MIKLEQVPSYVRLPIIASGALLSAFAGRLPNELQDIGLVVGLLLLAAGLVAAALSLNREPNTESTLGDWWPMFLPFTLIAGPLIVLNSNYILEIFTAKTTYVPEGVLSVGLVDLQQGPQVDNEKLLIQIKLKNTWDRKVAFKATRDLLVFNGTELVAKTNVVEGFLNGGEEINYRVGMIPATLLRQETHRFQLGFRISYGNSTANKQWLISRRMECVVPATNFNNGTCNFEVNTSEPLGHH